MDAHCLDAVAISMGPGSYTGLRIGVSMAKGVCFEQVNSDRRTDLTSTGLIGIGTDTGRSAVLPDDRRPPDEVYTAFSTVTTKGHRYQSRNRRRKFVCRFIGRT